MSTRGATGSQSELPQQVEITIPEGYAWFQIENATARIDELLYEKLAWKDPDAPFTSRYKRGNWDGYHRLYYKEKHMAPIGLLDRATEVLEENGYSVSVTTAGDQSGDAIDTDWNFPHPLREYQADAINNTLQAGGGIISLPTGAGKTVVAMRLINLIEQKTIVFVHTQELLYQWADRIEESLGVEPGMIGDDNWSEGDVTVATMQTLHERGLENLSESYGIAVFDECHRTSAAGTMQATGLDIDVEWRIGLSATPWRSAGGEELEIEAVIGGTAAEISAEQLIGEGYLAKPKFEFIKPDAARVPRTGESYHEVVKRCIELDPERNMAIAKKASDLAGDGYKVLVTVNRLAQGKLLEYALNPDLTASQAKDDLIETDDDRNERQMKSHALNEIQQTTGQSAVFLQGSNTTAERQETLTAFQEGDIDILITTLLKEGADIPEISAIVIGEGGKSKIEKIQRIGRALRPENGDHAVIADVRDEGEYIGDHYEQRIENLKEYYGNYGPDNGFSPSVQAVRDYLKQNGIRLNACRVTEAAGGAVAIELTDYLGDHEFRSFMNLMRDTDGITYTGNKNVCSPNWVRTLPTAPPA